MARAAAAGRGCRSGAGNSACESGGPHGLSGLPGDLPAELVERLLAALLLGSSLAALMVAVRSHPSPPPLAVIPIPDQSPSLTHTLSL